jgi:sensor c-di-GMP phosphodiesterase-like protein
MGYSSLNYLTHYPIRALKIDKTFVDGIDINSTNKVKEVLIDTTLYLAKSLNLGVTAEGIETEEQLSYLKQRKCKYGQGYFFSKPLPFHEATLLLQNEHNTKCTACVAHLLKSEQHQESKHNE